MRILVTGSADELGRAAAETLLAAGHQAGRCPGGSRSGSVGTGRRPPAWPCPAGCSCSGTPCSDPVAGAPLTDGRPPRHPRWGCSWAGCHRRRWAPAEDVRYGPRERPLLRRAAPTARPSATNPTFGDRSCPREVCVSAAAAEPEVMVAAPCSVHAAPPVPTAAPGLKANGADPPAPPARPYPTSPPLPRPTCGHTLHERNAGRHHPNGQSNPALNDAAPTAPMSAC